MWRDWLLLGAQSLLDVFSIFNYDVFDIVIKMDLDRLVRLLNYHTQECFHFGTSSDVEVLLKARNSSFIASQEYMCII